MINSLLICVICACVLSKALAFAPKNGNIGMRIRSKALSMSDMAGEVGAEATEAPPAMPVIPKKVKKIKAKWLPVGNVMAPTMLDGELAGDVGFDPFNLSRSKKTLYWMREAEIKHARLAMLAAVGWPLSELWHKQIAAVFGFPSILVGGDRVPSLLNGGLSNTFASGVLVMSIILAGYLEGKSMNEGSIFWAADKPEGYIPGDLGFDPLNLAGMRGDKKKMQAMEIKNGRLAMLAITAFAFSEAATGMPVVQQTPYLF